MIHPYLGGSVAMQEPLKPFDGTEHTYTTDDILNAITADMVMIAETEQIDSPYYEA